MRMSRVRLLSPAPSPSAPDERLARLCSVTQPTGPLVALAHACGVMTDYVDWRGQLVRVSGETIEAVLRAMGVDRRANPPQLRNRR